MPIAIEPGLELKEILGEGATSTVYRAIVTRDLPYASPGTEVAVKLFRREPTGKDLQRFEREFTIGTELRTPYVARYYSKGLHKTTFDNRAYLVMEYIRGCSLKEELDRLATLPKPNRNALIFQLVRRILRALVVLAGNNIIHRDLQPNNILVRGGLPVLLDLGTSKYFSNLVDNATSVWEEVGTRRYWAPECLATGSDRWTPKTDVFMLGSCLIHLLTGRYLFSDAVNYPQFFAELAKHPNARKGYFTELQYIPELRRMLFMDLMLCPNSDFRPSASELLAVQTSNKVKNLRPFKSQLFPMSYFMWNLASDYGEQDVKFLETLARRTDLGPSEIMLGEVRAMYTAQEWLFADFLSSLFSFGLLRQTDPSQTAIVEYPDEKVICEKPSLSLRLVLSG